MNATALQILQEVTDFALNWHYMDNIHNFH